MGLRHAKILAMAPGDVRDDVLDRPLALHAGLAQPRPRDFGQQVLALRPRSPYHVEKLGLAHIGIQKGSLLSSVACLVPRLNICSAGSVARVVVLSSDMQC